MKKYLASFLTIVLCLGLCACGEQPTGNQPSSASAPADLSNTLVYAGEAESTINPVLNNHDELPDLIFPAL